MRKALSSILGTAVLLLILMPVGVRPAQGKAVGPPQVAWKDMTFDQKKAYMKEAVTPTMKPIFQAFDAKEFKKFDCVTCHGKDGVERKFKMPSNDIKPLPGTPEAFQAKMKTEDKVPGIATVAPAAASTGELVSELFKQSAELVKKEVALAKSEALVELKQEVRMAERLGVAAVCALCGLNLLLVAAAMALGHVLPEWAAALVVAGVVLLAGALAAWMGWGKRVRQPLERTQRTLKEDLRWAKERLA